jgi:hypothetical protein
MVHEIRKKSLFQIIRQSSKEIGYKTLGAFAFMGVLLIVIGVTFILAQQRQTLSQNAAYDPATGIFTATFDGRPSFPEPFSDPNWDVQVHSRDQSTWYSLEPMSAQHGVDCSAPPAVHQMNGSYPDAVFNCKDHIMTSIQAGGYGEIVLTPNAMLDFSNQGTVSFDVSTERPSYRDWIDLWIIPYDENVTLPFDAGDVDLQGIPKTGIHIYNSNSQSAFIVSTIQNYVETEFFKSWEGTTFNEGITAGTNQAAVRQPFRLVVTPTHLRFERLSSSTGTNVVFYDGPMPNLGFTQGVVQFAQHDYNPLKDSSCTDIAPDGTCETSWHWDNVSISPAVPFTIIKAQQRFVDPNNSTVTFNSPAPANSMLRFSGIGIVQISFDGGNTWTTAQRQTSSALAGVGHGYSAGHQSSFWTPIPTGAQSVKFQFSGEDWYSTGPFIAQDFSIWSRTLLTGTNPTPTLIPTTSQPTNTPTPIPNVTATPVVPTPTNTPVPPTPTPIPPTPAPSTDATSPSITITYPTNGIVFQRNARISITANATDNIKVTKVEFYVNGVLTCTDTTSSYSCAWKIPGKPNAFYTLSAKAYDAAGNTAVSVVNVTAK